MPKDPYSDKDFEYERTERGFILRCRVADERKARPFEFEFGARPREAKAFNINDYPEIRGDPLFDKPSRQ